MYGSDFYPSAAIESYGRGFAQEAHRGAMAQVGLRSCLKRVLVFPPFQQQHQQRQAKVGGFAPGGCGPSDIDDSGSRVSSGSGSSSGSSSGPGVGGEAGQLQSVGPLRGRARWGLLGSHGTCPRRPPAPRAGGRRPPAPSPQCPGRSRHSSAKQGAQRPCESRRQRVRAAPARVKSSRPDAYQVLD